MLSKISLQFLIFTDEVGLNRFGVTAVIVGVSTDLWLKSFSIFNKFKNKFIADTNYKSTLSKSGDLTTTFGLIGINSGIFLRFFATFVSSSIFLGDDKLSVLILVSIIGAFFAASEIGSDAEFGDGDFSERTGSSSASVRACSRHLKFS